MLADTVGEMCNMIAGGWKKRQGQRAWGADLSVPSISSGRSPAPNRISPSGAIDITRTYAFDGSPFVVHLTKLQPVHKRQRRGLSPAALTISLELDYFTTD